MESEGAMDRTTAAAQLAVLRSGREQVAARAMQPWWYDALLGLLVFQLVASFSFDEWVTTVAAAILVVGCVWLVAAYQRVTGFWVAGLRPGRTQRAIRVSVVCCVVVLALAGVAEFGLDRPGAMAVGGAVLGVGVALVSRWWTRLYIAELREEP